MRILVAGASIAGTTAAYWLGEAGHEVTVVERAPEFQDSGQNIDIRGVGREVMRRMSLDEAALERGTGEEGTVWVDENGETVAEFTTSELEGDGPTAEMEILRGDLARLIYEAACKRAEFRFGDFVKAIDQEGDAATVTFESGKSDDYDAVVVAEGVGSSTRELILPGENEPRWMDLTIGYFTIPRIPSDDDTWRWYNMTGGRSISLRPHGESTTSAMLSIQKQGEGEQDWDIERQKAWLHETFADAGWQAERVLAGLADTEDFYFEVLRQVRLPRWSEGRVVLTGDAAWCATPLAGIGATLAVAGAYVLAQEMARASDLPAAFAAYEKQVRPMVEDGQGVPKIGPRMMNPRSRLGIALLHGELSVAARPSIQNFAAKMFSREPEEPDLARYD